MWRGNWFLQVRIFGRKKDHHWTFEILRLKVAMSNIDHDIFIYGTLLRGGSAHHLMQGAPYLASGKIKGKIIHVDQYPGLIQGDFGWVKGEIFRVNDTLLQELDRYEGCFEYPPHYLRLEIEVLLEKGEMKRAQVYVFQLSEPCHEIIAGGDWLEWFEYKSQTRGKF